MSRRESGPGAGDPRGLINLKFGAKSLSQVTSKTSETLKAGKFVKKELPDVSITGKLRKIQWTNYNCGDLIIINAS